MSSPLVPVLRCVRSVLAAGGLAVAVASLPAPAAAAGVAWQQGSFADLLARAAHEQKPLVLDLYASWCGPCHALDEKVFPTDLAGAATAGTLAMRVDAETPEGEALVARYHVVGYPTVLVLRPDGEEIDRVFGYLEPDAFAETVRGYLAARGTIDELRRRVSADPNNLNLVAELGERAAVRGARDEALRLLNRVISEDSANSRGLRAQAHLVLGKYLYLRGDKNPDAALAQFAILDNELAATPQAAEARVQSVIAHLRAGRPDRAVAVCQALLQHARNSRMHNSLAWIFFREKVAMDRAIEIARQGLALNPADDGLWDTLAELQFATGDAAGAVASEREAGRLDPSEHYYVTQLARFAATAKP